jgi:putative heme-binding domain-containing protein
MTIESVDRIGAEMIKTISTDRSLPEQRNLAKLLAKKRASMPWLLQGLRDGWLSAEVLRDVTVKQGIESLAEPDDREKVDAMLASLPSMDANVEDLAKKIATKMEVELGNVENGALLFQKNCANCHQLGGQGSLIGPQLDGAVVRSSSRLLEDILFPDRNVDQAFRMTSLLIDDEWVRVGLLRNESADFVELVENNGKTVRISVDSISERKLSPRSLMPSGLQEALGEEGLIDLLSFLQSNRKTSPPPQ